MKNGVINDRVEHLERVYNQLHGFQDDMHEKNKTIDGLNETISDLRMAASDMLDTIDELKDFIRDQCGCVDDRDNRIEQLIVLNEALRVDIDGQDNHIEALKSTVDFGQSRIDLLVEKKSNCIDELMKDLDARNTVIKDFKAIEQKETDRLHTVIAGNGKIIDELNDMYCDVCGKLERIENISKKARTFGDVINRVSANHIAIDEITKIIQEE
jgi:chromosome segregation ATPase